MPTEFTGKNTTSKQHITIKHMILSAYATAVDLLAMPIYYT